MNKKRQAEYEKRYAIDGRICQRCGKPATQIAHRIANTKVNRKYWGELIDNCVNLVPVCNLECNASYNIGMKPIKCNRLQELAEKDKNYTSKSITKYIED